MLRPATGESATPRMPLFPGVAGPPGKGGSNGGDAFATSVDDCALGCDAQGSAPAFGAAVGLPGGVADFAAGSAALAFGSGALAVGFAVSLFAGFLAFASISGIRTKRVGKGFGGSAVLDRAPSAGTPVPATGGVAVCELSCPSSARRRCSIH